MTQPKYGVGICLNGCDSVRPEYIGPELDIEEYGICLGCGAALFGLRGTEIVDVETDNDPR